MYKRFKNKKCLEVPNDNCKILNLKLFLEVEDFHIKLVDTDSFGYGMVYYSDTLGILADFPWYDYIDKELRKMSMDEIYNGKVEKPFNDVEQGWEIMIFTVEKYVYVLQGEIPCGEKFNTWFKVRKEIYYKEWEKVLKQARELEE